MKTILLILFFSIYTVSAQIQDASIKPLESYYLYPNNDNLNIQDGFYFKDVNNLLDPYVGTWIGNYDNKTLHLEISIQEKIFGIRIYFDELLIKYKITDSNGQEIINTLDFFDTYKYHMNGRFFDDNPFKYYARYTGLQWECNQKGTAVIDLIDSDTISFWILPDNDFVEPDCPTGNIHIMPTASVNAVTLSKQN